MKRIVICLFTLALLITLSSALALPALAAVDDHTHSYKLAAVRKEPTCTTAGTGLYRCEVCGHQEMRDIPALGHKWSAWKTTKAATCGADGTRQQVCKVCGAKGKTEIIPATGKHTWTKWTITKAPTCKAAGEQSRSCSVCGEKQTKVAPKTDEHTFGAWTVTQAASCEQAGEEKRACGLCGKEESRAIDALGHDWDKGVTTVPAGYLETGVKTYTCARCGATKTEEVPVNAPMSGGSIMDQLRNIPPDAGSQDELRIVTQPEGGSIDPDGSLTLSVEAAGGTPPYTYQWRGMSTVTGWPFWFNAENGTDSTLEAQKGNRRYYCQVYDAKGNHVDSARVLVTYNLYIAQQPENTSTSEMDPVILSCTAAGGEPFGEGYQSPYVYVWMDAEGNIVGFEQKLVVPQVGEYQMPQTGEYYCVVEDNALDSVTSKTAIVYDADPFEAKTDAEVVELLDGQDYELWAHAYGGIEPYTGVWLRDGVEIPTQPGDNGDFTAPILGDGSKEAVYTFLATDAMEDTASCTVKVVYPQLKIARQPQGGMLPADGSPLGLDVVMAEGEEPFRYYLYHNGELDQFREAAGISGDFKVNESGEYYIHITDATGRWADSDTAAVRELTFHIDHIDVAGSIIQAGDKATLTTVVEGGVEPIRYSWWHRIENARGFIVGDKPVQDGPDPVLETSMPGLFMCYVRDSEGGRDVMEARVPFVGPGPIIVRQPESVSFNYGRNELYSATLICEAFTDGGHALKYEWERKGVNGWKHFYTGDTMEYAEKLTDTHRYYITSGVFRCKVTDTVTGYAVYSNEAAVTMPKLAVTGGQVEDNSTNIEVHIEGGSGPYTVTCKRWRHGLSDYGDFIIESYGMPDHLKTLAGAHSADFRLTGVSKHAKRYEIFNSHYTYRHWTYVFTVTDAEGNTESLSIRMKSENRDNYVDADQSIYWHRTPPGFPAN